MRPAPNSTPDSIDIFCRVIDNLGDAGVCGRLTHQLATEHHKTVRLFIDQPACLNQILPDLAQHAAIIPWSEALRYTDTADLVIEAFACDLPDRVLTAMMKRTIPPVWIDLEYLTAEKWADTCHAIPSTHPMTGLKKTLFFPGFTPLTGGLIRERDLIAHRNRFQNNPQDQTSWRQAHNLPPPDPDCIDGSIFCYPGAPCAALFDDLSTYSRPVRLFQPVTHDYGQETRGALTLYRIPFLSQKDYDRLLWTCDVNFVRGEDSFVRAQLAGRPLLWNIYVQEEQAHLVKLDAFLDLYTTAFSEDLRKTLAKTFHLWNEIHQTDKLWRWYLDHLQQLTEGANRWSVYLEMQPDLSDRLLEFCKTL
ncbi:MAG: elongation factor P maturation arginine rhamnosyltransferase EarP [Rhodospirillales bacterium]|nr:elongation factor P maturation arginine rhamnosyltransferase EarP [Rhodospirillales bacterium]